MKSLLRIYCNRPREAESAGKGKVRLIPLSPVPTPGSGRQGFKKIGHEPLCVPDFLPSDIDSQGYSFGGDCHLRDGYACATMHDGFAECPSHCLASLLLEKCISWQFQDHPAALCLWLLAFCNLFGVRRRQRKKWKSLALFSHRRYNMFTLF